MADESDIENAMVSLIGSALYPAGDPSIDGVASPVCGCVARIYRGFPAADVLEADLAAGAANITVFPEPNMTRNTTRYQPVWQQLGTITPSVTATVSGLTVTLGGTPAAGHVVGVQYGKGSLLTGQAVRFGATDTLTTAATALAAKVAGATSSGPVITMPSGTANLTAMAVCDQAARLEVRRQQQGFRVSTYCPSPAARDAIGAAVDLAIAGLVDANGNPTTFLTLADGTKARMAYRTTFSSDMPGKIHMWRRDLCYTAEFGTTINQSQPEVLFVVENFKQSGLTIARAGTVDA